MDHAEVKGNLQAYLDGALPPQEADAARAHLDGCDACRVELALLRQVDQALRAWPVLPEPEGLAARVMDAVQQKAAPPRLLEAPWPWLRAHWSEALLGAAVAATIVVLLLSGRALSARLARGGYEVIELRFWGLQVQRSLAAVERVWYTFKVGAHRGAYRGAHRGVPRGASRAAVEFYCWAAGAVALVAGAASAWVLARQWRGLRGLARHSART